jgi:hypothetical protein
MTEPVTLSDGFNYEKAALDMCAPFPHDSTCCVFSCLYAADVIA